MIIKIRPSQVNGSLDAPASKSMTHRALICAALAKGESYVQSPLISDDTDATKRLLESLGVKIEDTLNGYLISGGTFKVPLEDLYCGESGTTMRLMTAICALVDDQCKLTGGIGLSRRPIGQLLDGLIQLGVECTSEGGYPPVTVNGTGRLKGGVVEIQGDVSSQYISALLLVAPNAEDQVDIMLTTALESKPYVYMTMDVQRVFGVDVKSSKSMDHFTITPQKYASVEYTVEGDWSSASYMLAAGALTGEVSLGNLNLASNQADAVIYNILQDMGAGIWQTDHGVTISENSLHAIDINLSDSPDLFPMIAALCSQASGVSTLRGLRRLKYKESNRVESMAEGLKSMGVKFTKNDDIMMITGGETTGSIICPYNDHRIAMAFAVLALTSKGETTIQDAECVSKSYPNFWDDLRRLGANIEVQEK